MGLKYRRVNRGGNKVNRIITFVLEMKSPRFMETSLINARYIRTVQIYFYLKIWTNIWIIFL